MNDPHVSFPMQTVHDVRPVVFPDQGNDMVYDVQFARLTRQAPRFAVQSRHCFTVGPARRSRPLLASSDRTLKAFRTS